MTQKRRRVRKSKWVTSDKRGQRKDLEFERDTAKGKLMQTPRWFNFLIILTFVICIGVFYKWMNKNLSAQDQVAQTEKPVEEKTAEFIADPVVWKSLIPEKVAIAFKDSESAEERLKLLYQPKRVGDRARDFFTNGPGSREKITKLHPEPSFDALGASYLNYIAILEDGATRMLCIRIGDNSAKIDFDTYSRYGSSSWEDILSGKVTEIDEIRVFLKLIHFYAGEFSDDQKWQSFKATSPDLEEPLRLYLSRENQLLNKLTQGTNNLPIRITVSIKAVGSSYQERQFELVDTIGAGWLSTTVEGDHN